MALATTQPCLQLWSCVHMCIQADVDLINDVRGLGANRRHRIASTSGETSGAQDERPRSGVVDTALPDRQTDTL